MNYIGFQKGRPIENDATHNPENISTVPHAAAKFLSKPGAVKLEHARDMAAAAAATSGRRAFPWISNGSNGMVGADECDEIQPKKCSVLAFWSLGVRFCQFGVENRGMHFYSLHKISMPI